MVFKCQSDSYLKEFNSKVVSCNPIAGPTHQYEVILEDTILFPEGGGQPCDYGSLNGVRVRRVIRRGDQAVHVTEQPLQAGEEVRQQISWERRFDHMQQHSGQHLITAVIDKEFQFGTVSWWLGEEVSYIELDTPQISESQIAQTEAKVNELIREGRGVSVEVYSSTDELKQVRARGLPEDHAGDIRVINIEGVERNMCCGTHVTNLCQLQVVKLLQSEKSKRKNQVLLYFLVGNRVLQKLQNCFNRELKLTVLLKNNPAQHTELVDKLQKSVKSLTKNLQGALKELALLKVVNNSHFKDSTMNLQAEKLNNTVPPPKFYSLHCKDADPDFMNVFIREMGDKHDILLFLSTGDEKLSGNIVLYGPEKPVAALGPKVCELLEGKGAGKGNKFQAKVARMANRIKAEQLIAEYFSE